MYRNIQMASPVPVFHLFKSVGPKATCVQSLFLKCMNVPWLL